MLQTIIDVSKHKPSVYFVVLLSLVIQTAVSIFYSFAAIAVYVTWTPGNPCEWYQRGRIGAIWVAVVWFWVIVSLCDQLVFQWKGRWVGLLLDFCVYLDQSGDW
jgi:hypothetical protein